MVHRRASIRPRPQERRFSLEPLERRDCPAVVSIAGPTELHENGAPVTLIATLSEPQSRPVTVHYTTTGSAKAGADYGLSIRAQRLRAPSGTFVFPAGVTSLPITLTPRNDALREGTETIGFNLAFARGHTLGSNMAAVALIDDDSYTASIVGPARVEAGVTTTYRLQLSSPATKREVFYLSTDSLTASSQPTADDPTADYFPLTNVPVVIQAGETSRAFLVRTIASAANEPDQDFLIRTTPVSSGFGAVDPFGVTIIGNAPSPLPAVSVSDVTITEGNSGSTVAAFTISLSSPSGQPVTVTYATADGTATAASGDYEPKTGQVTIAPGATATTVAVNVRGDTTPEPDETFSLAISSPSNATLANASGTATIRNDDTTPATSFNIVVTFPDSSLTQSQRRVFTQATARWSQIIIGDLPDVTYGGRLIDDLEIVATAPAIDGPGQVLGQAGPDQLRQGGGNLPFLGVMEFDSADVSIMELDGTLFDVILHEMGHVLGIGTLWSSNGLVVGEGSADPRYIGPNAVREFRTLSGNATAVDIPVENTGGPGTADGHWRESVFGSELMTGRAEPPGVASPISRMTTGALEDLGYLVNYASSDSYTIPAAVRNRAVFGLAVGNLPLMASMTSRLPSGLFASLVHGGAPESAGPPARQRAFARLLPS